MPSPTACQIIGHPAVVVVGSQAILGSFAEDTLPLEATMSVEIDILPLADDNDETARLADLIEGVAGEWSPVRGAAWLLHGWCRRGDRRPSRWLARPLGPMPLT
jgi:hypothetical protein